VEVKERLHTEDETMETRKEKIQVEGREEEFIESYPSDPPLKTDLRIFIVRKKEGTRWRQDQRGVRRPLKDA
jgi:hypothetical protein